MGKWLSEFLADHQESGPDIPDTLDSLSGVSGSETIRAGEKNCSTGQPITPLQSGWLVVYRNREGKLCGGSDDRAHGTVSRCDWTPPGWTLWLTDGQQIPLRSVTGVTRTNAAGDLLAAWEVRTHGLDGNKEAYG